MRLPCAMPARRHTARALLALALAGAALHTPAAEAVPGAPGPVRAPHHGSTLFHFFQGHDFDALGALMVSQHFQRLSPHDDEAEVLRGGLLLSYGLHQEAGQVFARLIEHQAPPSVQNRAWFYLARIRHQRGLPDEAEAALSRISGKLPDELETQRHLLSAQLLMGRGAYTAAAQVLKTLAQAQPAGVPDSALAVAQFNLGVALIQAGQADGPFAPAAPALPAAPAAPAQPDPSTAQGLALLDTLGQQPAADEEQRALRDRANLALGLAALRTSQPGRAQALLQRVRLNGPYTHPALLGLGWAVADQGQPQQALAPWAELVDRSEPARAAGAGPDTALLEARVALPHALAEAGAWGEALTRYEQAVQRYAQEHDSLQAAITTVNGGGTLQALLARHTDTGMGWFARLDDLPDAQALPHAAALAPVLASHGFQEGFKNWRDLHHAGQHLTDWRQRLQAFDDMLTTRRLAYAERLPPVLQHSTQAGTRSLAALQARQRALADEVARVETDTDAAALADTREQALQQRLTRAQAVLISVDAAAAQATGLDLAGTTERLRRLSGALRWQQAQQFPARLWSAKKALLQGTQALDEAQGREAALVQAQRSEPARHEAYAARITALAARLEALLPQLQAAAGEQQAALQAQAVAALQAQQARLAAYSAQALLGRAQLLDRMQLAQRGGLSAVGTARSEAAR
jgi:hypothetical protein